MPGALKRAQSQDGFRALWRKVAETMYSPRILGGLPKYTAKLAKSFWASEPDAAIYAANHGDVAFFVAFMIRIDQIHVEMFAAKRSLAERAPLVRCRHIVDGFMQAAIEKLKEAGGEWPPSPPPT